VAVLVKQLSGSGDVAVPEKVDTEVLDAFRLALFWARLNEAGNAGKARGDSRLPNQSSLTMVWLSLLLNAAIHKAFSHAPRCRPACRPDMDMHLMLPYFRYRMDGPSVGAALVLGVVQCMTGCQLVTRVGPKAALLADPNHSLTPPSRLLTE
jgi:hypothetical protein